MKRDQPKILYIESIRGIAAFLVVFAHIVVALDSPPSTGVPWSVSDANPVVRTGVTILFWPLATGRLPVATFFILSGMALSQGFLRGGGQDYLRSAAVRRYFRLMIPSLVSVLFAFALLKSGMMHNREASAMIGVEGGSTLWLDLSFSQNWTFNDAAREGMWTIFFSAEPFHDTPRLNDVLWTMRPELIGSLIVFAFLALFGHHASQRTFALLVAVLLAMAGFTMLALFPIGVWVALTRQSLPHFRLSMLPALMLILVGLGLGGLYDYTGRRELTIPLLQTVVNSAEAAPCVGAVLLVLGLVFTPRFTTLLEAKIFVWLGKISFGLYLCHVPIIMSVGCWAYVTARAQNGVSHGVALLAVTASVVPLSLLVGWVMHYVADQPSIAFGKLVANRLLNSADVTTTPLPVKSLRPIEVS